MKMPVKKKAVKKVVKKAKKLIKKAVRKAAKPKKKIVVHRKKKVLPANDQCTGPIAGPAIEPIAVTVPAVGDPVDPGPAETPDLDPGDDYIASPVGHEGALGVEPEYSDEDVAGSEDPDDCVEGDEDEEL
jgi:hypothetical protein